MSPAGAQPRNIRNRPFSSQSPLGCLLPDPTNARHSEDCVSVRIVSHGDSDLSRATATTTSCNLRLTTHAHNHISYLVSVKKEFSQVE
jgi:hypothetical protein